MADRWLGGTLTNNDVIMRRARYMKKLRKMEDEGDIDKMPNKEASSARRELAKLERSLIGIADMRKLPDVMVVVDIERDHIAVNEAKRLNIPVVALVDSNCNPDEIDYVVPGNDDAVRSVKLLMSAFEQAVKEGRGLSGRADEAPAPAPEAAAEPAAEEAAPAPAAEATEEPEADAPAPAEEAPPEPVSEEPAVEEAAAPAEEAAEEKSE
jgi:small subunit ribosomal protein S2